MTTKSLAAICWLAALIAVAAAATQHQTAMGIAGLVGAVAAIAWGLVRWLEDEPKQWDGRGEFYPQWQMSQPGCYVVPDDEDELPYRAPVITDRVYRMPTEWPHIEGGRRALWPNDAGSVE